MPTSEQITKEEASGTLANLGKAEESTAFGRSILPVTFSCERVNCHTPCSLSLVPQGDRALGLPALELRRPLVSFAASAVADRPQVIKPLGRVSALQCLACGNAENKIVGHRVQWGCLGLGAAMTSLALEEDSGGYPGYQVPLCSTLVCSVLLAGMASVRAIPGMARKHRLPFQLRKQILLN